MKILNPYGIELNDETITHDTPTLHVKDGEMEKVIMEFERMTDQEKISNMRYLVCMLNDQDYTDPTFQIYDTKETAFYEAMNQLEDLFQEKDSKIEVTHPDSKIRIEWSCHDRFFIIEIIPFEVRGNYLLVWHHAYNGVGFSILSQSESYNECVNDRIRRIEKMFEEDDFPGADNDDFDVKKDTCVDTGEGFEVFTVVYTGVTK